MQFGGTVLYVNDDSATVEFYREAFGLALRFFDTELGFAELDTGGSMLAIASHSLAERLTPGRYVDRLLGTATDAAGYEVTILAHYPPTPHRVTPEKLRWLAAHRGPWTGARVSFGRVARKHNRSPVELTAAFVLPGHGTLVIMEACTLSSRQRAASRACAFLPLPGIVG